MVKIYDLRDDAYTVKLIQSATLNTKNFGLKPDYGLFGSQEWWEMVERGVIPKHIIEGAISRVYMSGHNDFPEFEVTSEIGKKSWPRMGSDTSYVVGKKAKVVYIGQEFRKPLQVRSANGQKESMLETEVVLEIWIQA